MEKFDVLIVGGGILGTTLSYWLSHLYEGKIGVLDMEPDVACHTSGRNTGVIHRPFYLDPEKRKFFAKTAQVSYGLWKKYAEQKGLPWKEVRTIEVGTKPQDVAVLEKYMRWALANGIKSDEIELLSPAQVKKLEPKVECIGAVYSKTDTSVDYKLFTQSLKKDAMAQGVSFLFGCEMDQVRIHKDRLEVLLKRNMPPVETRFLINCAGGNSIDIAHLFSVGLEYTDLHFRGEYWEIAPQESQWIGTNIYSVPRHPTLPFLDPHWIVRANGKREIGPNAVLVSGSKTYNGFFTDVAELFGKVFEKPFQNKFNLFLNRDFLKLASEEWMSSISKGAMVKRVQKFIPELRVQHLVRKGTAGVRSSVIDKQGNFIKEAIELPGHLSYHITNYNSPGATGAPGYTATLARKLESSGCLSHLQKRSVPVPGLWRFDEVIAQVLEPQSFPSPA